MLSDRTSQRWKSALARELTALRAGQTPGVSGTLSSPSPWDKLGSEACHADVKERRAKRSRFTKGEDGWAWVHDEVTVRIDLSEPFAKGAMRECFRMKKRSTHLSADDIEQGVEASLWMHQHMYVAKRYMDLPAERTRQVLLADVKMQMYSKQFARKYNGLSPPKFVDFLEAYVIELQHPHRGTTWFVEAFVPGDYKKHNDNAGLVANKDLSGSESPLAVPAVAAIRNTPQAFSHFTHEVSQGDVLVRHLSILSGLVKKENAEFVPDFFL